MPEFGEYFVNGGGEEEGSPFSSSLELTNWGRFHDYFCMCHRHLTLGNNSSSCSSCCWSGFPKMPSGFDFLRWVGPENDSIIKFYSVLPLEFRRPFRPQFIAPRPDLKLETHKLGKKQCDIREHDQEWFDFLCDSEGKSEWMNPPSLGALLKCRQKWMNGDRCECCEWSASTAAACTDLSKEAKARLRDPASILHGRIHATCLRLLWHVCICSSASLLSVAKATAM